MEIMRLIKNDDLTPEPVQAGPSEEARVKVHSMIDDNELMKENVMIRFGKNQPFNPITDFNLEDHKYEPPKLRWIIPLCEKLVGNELHYKFQYPFHNLHDVLNAIVVREFTVPEHDCVVSHKSMVTQFFNFWKKPFVKMPPSIYSGIGVVFSISDVAEAFGPLGGRVRPVDKVLPLTPDQLLEKMKEKKTTSTLIKPIRAVSDSKVYTLPREYPNVLRAKNEKLPTKILPEQRDLEGYHKTRTIHVIHTGNMLEEGCFVEPFFSVFY